MIDINVKGLLYVSKAIIPQMIERKSGHIINIGSIAGKEVYQMETFIAPQTCC
jgi:NADP-dependent 3-hydroxy acid dehydrogenase YdfG